MEIIFQLLRQAAESIEKDTGEKPSFASVLSSVVYHSDPEGGFLDWHWTKDDTFIEAIEKYIADNQ